MKTYENINFTNRNQLFAVHFRLRNRGNSV